MGSVQRTQNPDVNSYSPDTEPGEGGGPANRNDSGSGDIERGKVDEVLPIPPGSKPAAPVEEPPESGNVPVGDVDDSPKRIA